jgi:hypothetical protein
MSRKYPTKTTPPASSRDPKKQAATSSSSGGTFSGQGPGLAKARARVRVPSGFITESMTTAWVKACLFYGCIALFLACSSACSSASSPTTSADDACVSLSLCRQTLIDVGSAPELAGVDGVKSDPSWHADAAQAAAVLEGGADYCGAACCTTWLDAFAGKGYCAAQLATESPRGIMVVPLGGVALILFERNGPR